MPELAEVEYFRKQWDAGLGQRVSGVALHSEKRVFRGSSPATIQETLSNATLRDSAANGKQLMFRFSKNAWLGIHLGMSGKLRIEPPGFKPARHDHLVLFQKRQTLVFADPRMFGRVRFHCGKTAPSWWANLPPAVTSPKFTAAKLRAIFQRRRAAPLKALLLAQDVFPGVGNWMADEILWQARLDPRIAAALLTPKQTRELWRVARAVCRMSLKTIGVDWSDPPDDWLIHQRWKHSGHCPRHGTPLKRATVAGRTTAWCPRCQKPARA
ncbi:MAG: formamidopyrimidine-DNA glycosylase [Chthoniobacter sp.]|jgi:formamidopyrimidine-DNA glycosylase|nr:formamidopyrimidine-DNA glycosylase [Chthoniobacter sp.]